MRAKEEEVVELEKEGRLRLLLALKVEADVVELVKLLSRSE